MEKFAYEKFYETLNYNRDNAKKTLYEYVKSSPAFNLNSDSLKYFNTKLTARELDEKINLTASAFKNLGLKEDDIMFMFCLNTPEMVQSFYALNNLGVIPEWFNSKGVTVELLRNSINEMNVEYIMITDVVYPLFKEAVKGTKVKKVIVNSLRDSFDMFTNIAYTAQILSVPKVLDVFKTQIDKAKKLEELRNLELGDFSGEKTLNMLDSELNKVIENKNLLESDIEKLIKSAIKVDSKETIDEKKYKLTLLQKKLVELENYSNKKLLRQKAAFHVDPEVSDTFMSWDDFMKYAQKGEIIKPVEYVDGKTTTIIHTGGTTANKNQSRPPYKSIAVNDFNINSFVEKTLAMPLNMDFNDSFCQLVPPIVAWSLAGLHMSKYYNMLTHLIPSYDQEEMADIILKTKANHWFSVPKFIGQIVDDKKLDGKDLSFMKGINHGGEAMTPERDKEIDEKLASLNSSVKNRFGFGQNEEWACFTVNLHEPEHGIEKDYGCCGIPMIGNKIKIMDDETGLELPHGEIGSIYLSGETVCKYFGADEHLNDSIFKIIDGEKYIFTGDKGHLSPLTGALYFYTRDARIIRTQDAKVFIPHLEDIANKIPGVKECCVVGTPHPTNVKDVACHIILEDELYDLPEEKLVTKFIMIMREIDSACSNLYTYYKPGTYRFERKFNLTPFGKVDFKQLEKENEDLYKTNNNVKLRKLRYKL